MSLDGRVALVTGGSRGIGRAVAVGLAADGADVAVNFRRDAGAAAEVVAEIEGLGRRAVAVQASVDDRPAVDAMVDQVVDELGPVGICVNNAGIASRNQPVADVDPEHLERVLRVHAVGAYLVTRAVLASMRTQARGDVVMVSSVAADHHGAGGAPYNMGKAAMESLAWTVAKEERDHGIRVNIVAPGLVATDMGQRLMQVVAGVDDVTSLDASFPFGRVCRPEDVAGAVRWLVSDAAGYVTGQRIVVDGGGPGVRPGGRR